MQWPTTAARGGGLEAQQAPAVAKDSVVTWVVLRSLSNGLPILFAGVRLRRQG